MNLLIRGLAVAVAAIALLAGIIALFGSRLPRSHVVSRSIFLRQSPHAVYAVARDFGNAPNWRPDVKRVEVETLEPGRVRFREEGKNGTVNYGLVEDMSGERMVTRILDTNLGYSGKWTYAFSPENGGTRVTIIEEGEVSNVLFRFMSKYVFGHTATLDSYLASLAKRFGEPGKPE
jgi:hypothetical protein